MCTVALIFFKQMSKVSPSNKELSIYFTDKCPFDLKYLNGGVKTFVKTLTAGEIHWEGQHIGSILPSRTISDIFGNFHELECYSMHLSSQQTQNNNPP